MAQFGTSAEIRASIGSFGSAVGDIFGAQGLGIQASTYRQAAGISRQNLGYVQESNRIKKLQAERTIAQTLGGQQADIAGSGLKLSGSAIDVVRDSASQADLTRHLIDTQGKIDENTVMQQIISYEGQANAADNAEEGKMWSAGINVLSGLVSAGSFFA